MVERIERRRFERVELACPITIRDGTGQSLAKTRTANVSDGAVFAPVPIKNIPACGSTVSLHFSVPRTTPNTRMLEDIDTEATVVRHQALSDDRFAGVAMLFTEPMPLQLEA